MINSRLTGDVDIVSASGRFEVRNARRRSRLVIDFAARSAALSAMRGSEAVDELPLTHDVLAARMAWPRDALIEHAAVLAERGMPIAQVYAAAAAASVERSIQAIAAAELQEGWPLASVGEFRAGALSEWL